MGVRRAAQVADMTIMRVELAVAEALAHRELGDRARALDELTTLADAPAETMLFCRVLAMCELAQAHVDEGRLGSAQQVLGPGRRPRRGGGARGGRAGLDDPRRHGARRGPR